MRLAALFLLCLTMTSIRALAEGPDPEELDNLNHLRAFISARGGSSSTLCRVDQMLCSPVAGTEGNLCRRISSTSLALEAIQLGPQQRVYTCTLNMNDGSVCETDFFMMSAECRDPGGLTKNFDF